MIENVTINEKFDLINKEGVTLTQLKELIRKNCKFPEELTDLIDNEKESLDEKLLDEENQMNDLEQEFEFNEVVCDTESPGKEVKEIKTILCETGSTEIEIEEIKKDVCNLDKGLNQIAMLKDKLTPIFKVKPDYMCYAALFFGCLFVIARMRSK